MNSVTKAGRKSGFVSEYRRRTQFSYPDLQEIRKHQMFTIRKQEHLQDKGYYTACMLHRVIMHRGTV